jgi:hypothetical protein
MAVETTKQSTSGATQEPLPAHLRTAQQQQLLQAAGSVAAAAAAAAAAFRGSLHDSVGLRQCPLTTRPPRPPLLMRCLGG